MYSNPNATKSVKYIKFNKINWCAVQKGCARWRETRNLFIWPNFYFFFRSHLFESLDGAIRITFIRIARLKIVKNYPCFRILLIIHYTFEFIPINFVPLELKGASSCTWGRNFVHLREELRALWVHENQKGINCFVGFAKIKGGCKIERLVWEINYLTIMMIH